MAGEDELVGYLKRVAAELHDTRLRLAEVEERNREPVAIVSMACRYPGGVTGPEDLWDLVAAGTDAVGEFPAGRGWDLDALYHPDPEHLGTTYTREGGFLYDADRFDAAFFNISPREAVALGPQQRVLLETTWELFERAGIDPTSLRGSTTGVYAGTATTGTAVTDEAQRTATQGYAGYAPSMLSGRLAYTFGLEGPAVTIETACSSSLVAIHLACQALRQGECALALAGGVTVMAVPEMFVEFSRQRGLAPDGRCKPFAAAADGTGWGEGAGLILLERLSDARRNGHRVLAVVGGSAINQDGASNGLTAPNGPSQQRVIRQALASARLSPADVDAVEAHGTGTTLGDPIEADALIATYGQNRDRPLWLGSVKSNIGHTQGAAGVAGVIKMVMAMRHGRLPATLHVDEPTPHVDWDTGAVRLLTEAVDWPDGERPRRAGVSSFGISGTNAHVILEQAPEPETPEPAEPEPAGVVPWVISARSERALRAQASRLATWPAGGVRDVGRSLVTSRTRFEHRAVVVGADREELRAGLAALAAGNPHPDVLEGVAAGPGPGPVLVFPGQGSQWAGMGAALLESSPVFAARIAACERALAPHVDWSLPEVLRGGAFDRVDVVQPALWAVMVSLAAVWEEYGVRPAAVIGHSQGEIAAACVAGALSLDDAARVVALRSRALRRLAGKGAMASLAMSVAEAESLLTGDVVVAAMNGPASTVISGPPEQVRAIVDGNERARVIDVDYASHGPQVDEITGELTTLLADLSPVNAEVAFYSTLTGSRIETSGLDTDYWITNLRRPVRFAGAVRELLSDGYRVFIEASPHPVLGPGMLDAFAEAGVPARVVPTLRRDDGDLRQVARALGQAFTAGVPVDWTGFFPGERVVELPTYAFQGERYWPEDGGAAGGLEEVELADGGLVLTGRLSAASQPWLADHAVAGTVLAPGTAFVEWALRAGERAGCDRVAELTLETPLVLSGDDTDELQVTVGAAGDDGRRSVEIHSRRGAGEWVRHATGTLTPGGLVAPEGFAWPPPDGVPVDLDGCYERLAERGYSYGPAFQGLVAAWRSGGDLYADVALPDAGRAGDRAGEHGIHPALFDAALHVLALDADRPMVPFTWTGVQLHATGADRVRVRLSAEDERVRLTMADPAGDPVLSVDAVVLRPVDPARLRAASSRGEQGLLTMEWVSVPAAGADAVSYALVGVGGAESLRDLTADPAEAPGVVVAVPPAEGGLTAVVWTLALVRDWLAEPALEDSRLVVAGGEAGVWGLVRSAQSEHPGRFVLVDAGEGDLESAVRAAVGTGEPQVRVRDGEAFVPRLKRVAGTAGGVAPAGDRTVWITGGTGLLGGLVAEHVVTEWGVRHLILSSRRGADAPGADDLVARLEALGASVRVVAADVADRDAVAGVVAAIDPAHPLTGVIHSAGVLDDAVVGSLSAEQVAKVWAAKATGAWNLHAATEDLGLDLFVVFSSAAGIFGNPGQAGYAAACMAADAVVELRRERGLAGTSVAWGLWEPASAMTGHLERSDLARLRGLGMRPLSVARGMALLDAAVTADAGVMVAADVDLTALHGDRIPTVLRGLAGAPVVRRRAAGMTAARRLAGMDVSGLVEVVAECVAGVLGYRSPGQVRAEASFKDLGFDSLTAVELRNRLSTVTGVRLPATLVFDYPTPRAVAEYLARELTGQETGAAAARTAGAGTDEPIAIVGMACRYPGGVADPEGLWDLVAAGVDAMGDFPRNRHWDLDTLFDPDPDHPRTSYADQGAFIYDADRFDPGFFGINPREALATDPQQRLLLEVAWEVLERAGIDPTSLKASATGVYAGVMYHDYASAMASADAALEGYGMLAGSGSVVSGRISYTFGFEGPAVTVDTACSSSLVAMHLAAQALRQGECDLALAGGVTVLATPEVFTGFSRQRGLAPDGRCKPFAAAADGTGWGEGAGLLLLERLSDARRNGRRILAVIRGSAVNQDGASNGLTAPNGPSQQRVIRQALANARLSPAEVDVVEGHGTGTSLGDPIEAQALLATYGQDRDEPLWLGSVKSNIGHTQAAAGVAGVIKMVMAMRHGRLPASLHIDEPTPHVDWDAGAVRLLTEATDWPSPDRPRRAGVSSFGASGTNAHVILEQAPDTPEPEPVEQDGPFAWVVSARSAAALRGQAGRLATWLREQSAEETSPADVAWSLVTTRATFEHRAVLIGTDQADLLTGLAELADGNPHPNLVQGTAGPVGPGPVLVFPGQGSQWTGMGAALLQTSPTFANRIAECEQALAPHIDWSLTEVLRDGGGLDRVDVVQPALWAVMISLAAVWAEHGVTPSAVIGHSQGEIAAASVAGALTLEDAARVVALRSRALRRLSGKGAMASLAMSTEEATPLLGQDVVIAAINGPASTVISGPPDQIQAIVDANERARRIDVDYASHGPQVDEITDELRNLLAGINPAASDVAFYSTLTGARIDTSTLDTEYWITNLRQPVRFADAINALLDDGYRAFIESSPHPVLTPGIQDTIDQAALTATTIPTLRRDQGDHQQLLHALAHAHTTGIPIDWTTTLPTANTLDLPTYAFQRERFWPAAGRGVGDVVAAGLEAVEHPLLPVAVPLADGGVVLSGRLRAGEQEWLRDHQVADQTVVAGAVLVEWALRAADTVGRGGVEELVLQVPLVLPESGGLRIQVVAGDDRTIKICSRPEDGDGEWLCHATGTLLPDAAPADGSPAGAWPPPGAEPVDVAGFYERAAAAGYGYGPTFQGLRAAWRHGDDLLAEVALPDEATEKAAGFGIHPALLDAALHPAMLLDRERPGDDGVLLPFAWNEVRLHATGASSARVRVSRTGEDVAIAVADTAGAPVLTVGSVAMRPADVGELRSIGVRGLFTVRWVALPAPAETLGDGPELVVVRPKSDGGAFAVEHVLTALQDRLEESRPDDARLLVVSGDGGVRGLVRSAQSEHPDRFVLADTDDSADVVAAARAAVALGEFQLRVRDGETLVPRLVRADADGGTLVLPVGEPGWRLGCAGTATVDNVSVEPAPEALRPLGEGEVRIAVHAAGINFRDALVSLGMVPGQTGLGSEGAGVVVEAGPGVGDLAVGDRVLGLLNGSFGPLVVADARMVTRVPEGWDLDVAAGVPVVFLTAWYGLVDLAGLRAGESVLIHAGTGGVGMAAVQIARYLGADVFATASPGKHAVLERMGIDEAHRANSRDLDFEGTIREATGGRGVDVVLNSLAGPFVDASLRLLAEGGRLIEMGKTDIRDPEQVAAEYPGVTYRAFDVINDAGPVRVGEMLAELVELFTSGSLNPVPVRAWPLNEARQALRHLSQARHTGKLVLRIPAGIDPDGTVLVTGGTGTLGGLAAEHVVRAWNVKRLLLVSRRGADAPGAAELVARLAESGAEARVVAADVADPAAVEKLVAAVDPAHPLTGVIHAAGVLDDAVLAAQTPDRLARVWGPKAAGAANLHAATAGLRLGAFVVFSSAAATLGSPGQANYAAANGFCEDLAAERRAAGLAGLSIGWGLWAATSDLTGNLGRADVARMGRFGVKALSTEQGWALFDAALRCGEANVVALNLDGRVLAARGAGEVPPLLRELAGGGKVVRGVASAGGPPVDWASRLARLDAAGRYHTLLDLVRGHAASVLGHASPDAVQPDTPFKELGFDSLTAVELRNRVAAATGLRLPAALIFSHPTAAALAGHLRDELCPDAPDESASILGELARLETAMTAITLEEKARGDLVRHLESMLWRLKDSSGETDHTVDGDVLDSASDDEMFEFIDRELRS